MVENNGTVDAVEAYEVMLRMQDIQVEVIKLLKEAKSVAVKLIGKRIDDIMEDVQTLFEDVDVDDVEVEVICDNANQFKCCRDCIHAIPHICETPEELRCTYAGVKVVCIRTTDKV